LLACGVLLAVPAAAQVLYKLVDKNGQVTYSDREPKGYEGTVTRIEQDTAPTAVPPSKPVEAKKRESSSPGIAETRRSSREALDAKVRAAQAKVDAARKARDDGENPRADELQTVQHRYPPLRKGEAPPRANCFHAVDPTSGAALLNCPTQVPQESYYERRKKLDDALRDAEAELAAAERAYRRGTD